mmetsp:Transcript_51654/g.159196  ORF Transcript_51654/g.159196 Transcript_51654/m.159196 type:complete len:357 (-) Transcript_51654:733-1803(-)
MRLGFYIPLPVAPECGVLRAEPSSASSARALDCCFRSLSFRITSRLRSCCSRDESVRSFAEPRTDAGASADVWNTVRSDEWCPRAPVFGLLGCCMREKPARGEMYALGMSVCISYSPSAASASCAAACCVAMFWALCRSHASLVRIAAALSSRTPGPGPSPVAACFAAIPSSARCSAALSSSASRFAAIRRFCSCVTRDSRSAMRSSYTSRRKPALTVKSSRSFKYVSISAPGGAPVPPVPPVAVAAPSPSLDAVAPDLIMRWAAVEVLRRVARMDGPSPPPSPPAVPLDARRASPGDNKSSLSSVPRARAAGTAMATARRIALCSSSMISEDVTLCPRSTTPRIKSEIVFVFPAV